MTDEHHAWIDEHLARAGRRRTGAPEVVHDRPWSTVARVPTDDGPVWLKVAGAGTRFEVPLYEVLAAAAPERVLTPLAVDVGHDRLLLPDGGPTLGDRTTPGPEQVQQLTEALVAYAELQRALEPHVDALSAAGVHDMRPAVMPQRLDEALDAVRRSGAPYSADAADAAEALRPQHEAWCAELAASPVPASLDHNDLHPWNVLDGPRFYDWGDAVLAHPFAALLVPLQVVQQGGAALGPVQDAYLEPFTDLAPRRELTRTLEIACKVAQVARVLTWVRAIRVADEQGAELDEQWRTAPTETLAAFAEPGYVGGA